MGQAYFSREIMRRFNPRSVRAVEICGRTDTEMVALCSQADIEVRVIPDNSSPIADGRVEQSNPTAEQGSQGDG